MTRFLEVKRHFNKPAEQYRCDLVRREPRRVVLRYVSDRPFRLAGRDIPVGSMTIADYREGRDYILWEMTAPDGQLIGHLIHLCGELRIREDRVEYQDMLLDVWRAAGEAPAILDVGELAAVVRDGGLSEDEAEALRTRARELADSFAEVLSEHGDVMTAAG